MGGKENTLTQICNVNLMLVPCNPLVHMGIVEDATNHYEVSTLITNLQQMGGNENTLTQICNINLMLVPCNPLVRMGIVEDATNHFEVSTLRTVSSE
jgi:hypothetical protein